MLQEYEKKKMPGARPYNMTLEVVTEPGQLTRERGCFAFMFTNIGDVKAYGNGMVINPYLDPVTLLPLRGETVSVAGHVEDLYKGNITIKFETPTAGTQPAVEVVQLFYTDLI